jgi:DNA polymerase-3 subunit epsilon
MEAGGPIGGAIAATVARLFATVAAIAAVSLLALTIWLGKAAVLIIAVLGAVILGALAVATWLLLNRLAKPLDRLALDLAVIGRDNPEHTLRIGRDHWLPRLVAAVEGLRQSLLRARQDTASGIAEATARAEEQKRQLEAILLDLSEGGLARHAARRRPRHSHGPSGPTPPRQ